MFLSPREHGNGNRRGLITGETIDSTNFTSCIRR